MTKTKDVENISRELCASFDAVATAMRNCSDIVSGFSKFVARLPPDVIEEALSTSGAQPGKRKRKQREKKDPNQPKRPTSAYLLFQNDVRKFYQDKMAGQPYSEVMSEIAKQWKELPEEKKAIYKQKVEAEKVLYGEKMREYQKNKDSSVAASVPAKKSEPVQNGTPSSVKTSTEDSEESEDANESEDESDGSEESEEETPPTKKTKSGKSGKSGKSAKALK